VTRSPTDPVAEIQTVYHQHTGGYLRTGVARAMVAAVYVCADQVLSVTEVASREQWERDEFRDVIRTHMRRMLVDTMSDAGVLQVSLPVETVTYFDGPPHLGDGRRLPGLAAERGAPWTFVEVRLEVSARTPAPRLGTAPVVDEAGRRYAIPAVVDVSLPGDLP
jgi:hypothetical protein